jgi:uncharacterized protein YbaA (DUF1428 family)
MGRYVDGFVIPVPKDRIEDYRQVAEKAAQVWKEYGALDYWECVGDDLEAKEGEGPLSFLQMAGATAGETVVFAWVVFESREKRDEANKKIMADPRLTGMMPEPPIFDYKKMAYGGFQQLVHA